MPACSACGADAPEGARFCPGCGRVLEERPATDERKLATVLFADLVGSTALGEAEDPERVRALLDRFYDAMAEEIALAGGTLEKFAGDAVMAVFGAPAAQEDHAERALHASLGMQRRLRDLFGERLSLRIGVNTGEVVVGKPREGSSFVTGDAVNVAARLEQAAAPGEILAGERTAAAVRGAFELDEARPLEAKGKAEPVWGRRVVRGLSLARPRGVGGLDRTFVGRETELALLYATYGRSVAGADPHLVTIMGDAGVGKTTLVRELWQALGSEHPEPLRRTGRCLPYGRGITYWSLGEMLREHYGIRESDAPETARARLAGREALGMALGLEVAAGAHPLAAREQLHEAFVAFFTELGAERPVVALFEDLHWAEDDLLDLVERLVRDVRGPLLVIGTARPELLNRKPQWGGGRRNAATIWLEPLSTPDAARMLDALLGSTLEPRFRQLVADRAEGNPFFVEEIVGALIDRGVLVRAGSGWRVDERADEAVPDTLHAVLAARIDLLPAIEKAALQAAAVIGRVFWRGPLVHLLEGVEPSLALLEERDFVRRRAGSSMAGDQEWAIKHALTREVAYASIPKARRARLHAVLGEWLESEGGGRDELAPLLAHHFAEAASSRDADLAWSGAPDALARVRAKALSWLSRAAELAIGRYELEDGIALLGRCLELETDPARQSELWQRIGVAAALRYDADRFLPALERAIELTNDPHRLADLYSTLAFHTTIRSGMWRRRPRRELVEGWIDRALDNAGSESVDRVRALTARAFLRPDKGADAAREASALAERTGDLELRSFAWAARAACASNARRYDEAVMWAQRRFDLIDEIRDPDHVVEVYESLIPAVAALARLGEARRLASAHIERSRSLSPHHRLHGVALALEVEELAGAWEKIGELTETAEHATRENAATPCIRNARSLLLCALAAACLGDEERAGELEREAAAYDQEEYGFSLSHPRLRLALLRGERETLTRLLRPQEPHRYAFGPGPVAVTLDALAALRDRDAAERLAADLLKPGLYLEPFALRALAIVREDDELLSRAGERFAALGLGWHAAQTPLIAA